MFLSLIASLVVLGAPASGTPNAASLAPLAPIASIARIVPIARTAPGAPPITCPPGTFGVPPLCI